jgi:hypothetical protein
MYGFRGRGFCAPDACRGRHFPCQSPGLGQPRAASPEPDRQSDFGPLPEQRQLQCRAPSGRALGRKRDLGRDQAWCGACRGHQQLHLLLQALPGNARPEVAQQTQRLHPLDA